jgi:hypothetical protein
MIKQKKIEFQKKYSSKATTTKKKEKKRNIKINKI